MESEGAALPHDFNGEHDADMSTFVTLQLNAIDVAGDWATRPAGESRTGTGDLGASTRQLRSVTGGELAVYLSELRGAVEAIRRGEYSANIAETRTQFAELGFGTPIAYRGLRFAVGA